MKKCVNCGELRPLSNYHANPSSKDKRDCRCKSCKKENYQLNRTKRLDQARIRSYGISRKEYDQKILEQNNACEICKLPFVPHKNPCVDHNHTTLAVRGLLCSHCNSGLGHFKESIIIMQSAQEYIKKYSV
jgi:hypothetical protein